MSYDYAIWKRSDSTKTAMLAEVYQAICNESDHPAMTKFDLDPLVQALKVRFGDYEEDPECEILGEPGSTSSADWLVIHSSFSTAGEVAEKIVPIAIGLGLLVYDPQREAVWGNKRPPKPLKPKQK